MDISETVKKLNHLKSILSEMENVIVAFSGGVDSTFLLKVAKEVLDEKVMAAIGKSHSFPSRELEESKKYAEEIGVKFQIVETKELDNTDYSSNPSNRCYYCKSELFMKIKELAEEYNYKNIIEGSNADDVYDYRPGMDAACDLGISSPLKEAGLSKDEIRTLSKDMGLPTWDKSSMPCLSSRIPYETTITKENLKKVEMAEQFLFDLGLKQYRVRYHNELARIEVLKDDMPFILKQEIADKILKRFKEIGFNYIALDLQGYRMGSMNEMLNMN